MKPALLQSIFWLLAAGAALPSVSWAADGGAARFVSDEVTLTLVADEPDADGAFRAALVIDLTPGWKTYWLDPGDAGIPPSIDLSKSSNSVVDALSFPAPHRFGDEAGSSNGYVEPVSVAVKAHEILAGEKTELRADVFIGVCREICIPVAATLSATPGSDAAGVVDAAFGALPRTGNATHGVLGAGLSSDLKTLAVTAAAPGSGSADLFVAGPPGWSFGAPAAARRDGGTIAFTVPVQGKPRHAGTASPPPLDMVMTSGDGAVQSRAVIPAVAR